MCTSVIHNGDSTVVGWNLDILDMQHRVRRAPAGVFIEINDKKEGWMPLFGVNYRGDFVAMPTCWPYDCRSDPSEDELNIINLDTDLLLANRTFDATRALADRMKICSVPGVTFQAQLSNRNGDVLQVTPGQGHAFFCRPKYSVMTNFSPFKGPAEKHPWMGLDRYETAVKMLETAGKDFDVADCFMILRATAQSVCPTVVSMVYRAATNEVYWCEHQKWDEIERQSLA